jgi:cytidylate kinase
MISIAIDGPSGAGKSSLAKALAKDLGYVYVDTGAMYRSIGLYAVRAGVDPHDADAVAALLPQVKLGIRLIDGAQHIYLNGEDVSTAIRAEEIGMAASAVAAHPAVRSFLLDTQRGLAESQNILMDGRDIGTVVLPNATVKIFLTASAEARAQRRAKELGLAAILRVFLLDSIALESLDKIPPNLPDCLDLLPGTMPKILRRVCATAKVPVLAGGLIADKEDVMAALEAGITAISTTNQAVWDM